jgi:hypothetical protein
VDKDLWSEEKVQRKPVQSENGKKSACGRNKNRGGTGTDDRTLPPSEAPQLNVIGVRDDSSCGLCDKEDETPYTFHASVPIKLEEDTCTWAFRSRSPKKYRTHPPVMSVSRKVQSRCSESRLGCTINSSFSAVGFEPQP